MPRPLPRRVLLASLVAIPVAGRLSAGALDQQAVRPLEAAVLNLAAIWAEKIRGTVPGPASAPSWSMRMVRGATQLREAAAAEGFSHEQYLAAFRLAMRLGRAFYGPTRPGERVTAPGIPPSLKPPEPI